MVQNERATLRATFAEEGGKTRLTMRSRSTSAAERDKVVREHGAIEGGTQSLDRLESYLATTERNER
jgi:uncharacterized protein YndB with AHSA1/START domain